MQLLIVYSAISNDVALEKSMCSFPGRVNVGFEMENFLNAQEIKISAFLLLKENEV